MQSRGQSTDRSNQKRKHAEEREQATIREEVFSGQGIGATMATLTRWAYFQKHYLKPEVYPVLGAVGVGLFAGAYFGYHKIFKDPSVALNKNLRLSPIATQYEAYGNEGHVAGISAVKSFTTHMFKTEGPNMIHYYNSPEFLEKERKNLARYRSE
ncbi:hypothetical protein FVE85_1773 [Porphyridium purpureum]|uniref:Transmembrane protein n=1 Tax=Porphyridium purpureum TaxID=35688 RepID=A0A5J4YWT8_PORPP|nr:hypothetical protein FVE85_1773 [Porphyridium purpureum]|eukprot:POR6842..scf209_3